MIQPFTIIHPGVRINETYRSSCYSDYAVSDTVCPFCVFFLPPMSVRNGLAVLKLLRLRALSQGPAAKGVPPSEDPSSLHSLLLKQGRQHSQDQSGICTYNSWLLCPDLAQRFEEVAQRQKTRPNINSLNGS